jgi:DNA-binding NtrC family response regulator
MSCETVLLLDLGASRPVSEELCLALAAAREQGIQIQRESAGSYDRELRDAEVRGILNRLEPELVFLLMRDGEPDAGPMVSLFELLTMPTIIVTEATHPEQMLELLELGASDFISWPFNASDLLPRFGRLLAHARRSNSLKASLKQKLGLSRLVGHSPAFVAEVNRIPLVAGCDATVLILGETGTGKELFARAIHYLGPRATKPFVPVNCGAFPAELIENELFGHERGAYTGAATAKPGLVAEADGGTLFLDEIDSLPLLAQVKLLRFLQDKEYRALGSTRSQRADLRIIAASNCDVHIAVDEGRFRRDLYYRLNVLPFNLPPLRERREDIPLLAQRFVETYAAEFDKRAVAFADDAVQSLMAYDWPGNVRELEHVIERAALLSVGPVIAESDIALPRQGSSAKCSFQEAKARVIGQFELGYLRGLLAAHGGNVTRAAQAAGKNRRAFFELLRKHNIDVQSFKAKA